MVYSESSDKAVQALVDTFASATPPRTPRWKKWAKNHQVVLAVGFFATLILIAAAIIATLVINYHKPSLGVETLNLQLSSKQVSALEKGLNSKIASSRNLPQVHAEIHSELTLTTSASPHSTQDVAQSEKLFAMVASGSVNAFLTPSSNLDVTAGNKLLTPIAEVATPEQMRELSQADLLLDANGAVTHELSATSSHKAVAIALDTTAVWKSIDGPKNAVFIFANVQKGKQLPRAAMEYFAGLSSTTSSNADDSSNSQ